MEKRETFLCLDVVLSPCDSCRGPDRGQSQPAEDGRVKSLVFDDITDGLEPRAALPKDFTQSRKTASTLLFEPG